MEVKDFVGTLLGCGLGNQMFQIAAVISLAKESKCSPAFNFDIAGTPYQSAIAYKHTIYKNLLKYQTTQIDSTNVYYDWGLQYKPIPFTPGLVIIGWFQSEKYFEAAKEEVVESFNFDDSRKEIVNDWISSVKSSNAAVVAFHVRRGDYLTNNQFCLLSVEYYESAFTYFKAKFPSIIFICVTDDKKYCETAFPGAILSPFQSDLDDMLIMMNADHVIIANSTFSWWGAYLNSKKDKTVIAPKKWFGSEGPQGPHDIIPEEWMQF